MPSGSLNCFIRFISTHKNRCPGHSYQSEISFRREYLQIGLAGEMSRQPGFLLNKGGINHDETVWPALPTCTEFTMMLQASIPGQFGCACWRDVGVIFNFRDRVS